MKILNFGSLNIDNVYTVEEFVRPGETVTAQSRTVFAGGKGLNQSLAAARAGADVIHAGAVGSVFSSTCSNSPALTSAAFSKPTRPPVTRSSRSMPRAKTAFSSGAAQTAS